MHSFLVAAVDDVPGLDRTSWWQGLLVLTAVLGVTWPRVRARSLASVIPR